MQINDNVKMLCSRVQTVLRRRKQAKATPEISAPFNFKYEPVCLPGVSEDELILLREKAAASRICVAEAMPHSPSMRSGSMLSLSRPPPIVTVMSPGATTSTPIY